MAMKGRDLFDALQVAAAGDSGSVTHAHRIDVGWAAWRASTTNTPTSALKRWAFRIKLWQHFGQAQFLVQVDDSYHTATSIRVRYLAEQNRMEVLLIQSSSSWQCLRGRWQLRRGKPAPSWRKTLMGQHVYISRYPETLSAASLPSVSGTGYIPCAEVLLNGHQRSQLPLHISHSR